MLHEIFGIDDVMRRQADRLAAAGYLALMPDLYSQGGTRRCLRATMKAMGSGTGRAWADIETARRYLTADPQCTARVGVIGFCLGGGFAVLAASRGFDAGSINYGILPKDLDGVFDGACPIVASYGGRDVEIRRGAERIEKALTAAGVTHDVKEYPKAGHSFMNDAMSGPRPLRPLMKVLGVGPKPEAAADAWQRIERFFAEHLKG